VRTVVWATGLAPSFPRLGAPVFDHRGRLVHDGGVLRVPGLFVLGLPFLRRRRSSFIDGAGGDAEVIARRIRAGFEQRRQVA
jgi:putative flavoprotein involved in K+ transport